MVEKIGNAERYENENHDRIDFDEYVDKDGNVSDEYIRVSIFNYQTMIFDGVIKRTYAPIMIEVFDDMNDMDIACVARFMREAVKAEKAVHFFRG